MQRNRPGFVALAAVVTAVIIVAVIDNQSATRSINDRVGSNPSSFGDVAERSLLTFQWRLTPLSGVPAQHLWGAQFAGIATFLILTFLLTLVVARGAAGFWQTWIGVWLSVIAATVAGVIVRGIVYPYTISHADRYVVGVFGFPSGEATFFGAVAGVVIGLVAALVMLATRRPAAAAAPPAVEEGYYPAPAAYPPVEQPPPFEAPVPAGAAAAAGYAAAGYGVASYDRPAYSGPGYTPVVVPQPQAGAAADQTEVVAPEPDTAPVPAEQQPVPESAPTDSAPTEAAAAEVVPTETVPTETVPTEAVPADAASAEAASTEAAPAEAEPTAETVATPAEPVPAESRQPQQEADGGTAVLPQVSEAQPHPSESGESQPTTELPREN